MNGSNHIRIDKAHTASFDVDCQKGFTPLCPDELPVPGGDRIVDALNRQALLAGLRIGSKDAHCREAVHTATTQEPQYAPLNEPDVDVTWNRHCVMGTRGAESLDGLPHWKEYDFFVWKGIEPDTHPYGACYHDLHNTRSTGVIEFLKSRGVGTVLVGGLATDFCVKNTAIQLSRAGFQVFVNLEACRAIEAPTANGETSLTRALAEMREAAVVLVDDLSAFGVEPPEEEGSEAEAAEIPSPSARRAGRGRFRAR